MSLLDSACQSAEFCCVIQYKIISCCRPRIKCNLPSSCSAYELQQRGTGDRGMMVCCKIIPTAVGNFHFAGYQFRLILMTWLITDCIANQVRLPACLSANLSVCLFVCPSVCLSGILFAFNSTLHWDCSQLVKPLASDTRKCAISNTYGELLRSSRRLYTGTVGQNVFKMCSHLNY